VCFFIRLVLLIISGTVVRCFFEFFLLFTKKSRSRGSPARDLGFDALRLVDVQKALEWEVTPLRRAAGIVGPPHTTHPDRAWIRRGLIRMCCLGLGKPAGRSAFCIGVQLFETMLSIIIFTHCVFI